jgi:hypothetical protein
VGKAKALQDFDAEVTRIDNELLSLGSEAIELVFRFISEDIHAWIENGGCLHCNGTGICRPWGNKAHSQDSILCPHCDGRSVRYSLAFAASSQPTSSYFPEVDYALLDAVRGLGLDASYPMFWTETRITAKAKIDNKTAKLKKTRQDILYEKQDALYKQSIAVAEAAVAVPPSNGEMPDLHGVSLKQINYGVVCRRAAIEGGKVTQEDAAKITSAVHWIENYKGLVRR